jgi:UDP-N-acetylglucosamine 3-dehydrogenase
MNSVRWGVLGLGWFGEVHADALATMPGIELAAVCTRRPDRLREVADRFAVKKRYTDYKELLADPDIDAVSIVTHIDDHCHIAVDALRAGKNVFLEKPMAPNVQQCDAILAAARESRGLFMVGHICRFDPRVAMAKEAIDQGRIGRIVSMHARRNLSKTIGRQVLDKISALMGDGIHDADLMLWFSKAKPIHVYAEEVHPGTNKYPDAGWAMFRLDSGAVGVVESIWHLPETTPYQIDARMEIVGTEGAIYINCSEAGLEIHDAAGPHLPDTMYWPKTFGERFGILRAELRYFADCVGNHRQPDRITPEESRAAVELMAAAGESARTGRIVRFDVRAL